MCRLGSVCATVRPVYGLTLWPTTLLYVTYPPGYPGDWPRGGTGSIILTSATRESRPCPPEPPTYRKPLSFCAGNGPLALRGMGMTSPPAVTTKSGADGSDGMLLIVMDNDGAFLPIRSVAYVTLPSSAHLHQRSFGLGQPEGHVHGTVQVDGGGQGGAGLLFSAGLVVQPAQPVVTVGYERTHP